MGAHVHLQGVGAAAPDWRIPAAEIGGGVGTERHRARARRVRSGRGPAHPGGGGRPRCHARRGDRPPPGRRSVVGVYPPALRRRAEPCGARERRSDSDRTPAARSWPVLPMPGSRPSSVRRTPSPPDRLGSPWSSPPTRCSPDSAARTKRAVARARPQSCSPRTRVRRPSPRESPAPIRSSTAIAVTVRRTTRDLYDPRLFREEMFLPPVMEVAEHLGALDVRAWSLPDPDGRLGGVVAKRIRATTVPSAEVYAAIGDCGAARRAVGWHRRARRGWARWRSSPPVADARPESWCTPTSPFRVRPRCCVRCTAAADRLVCRGAASTRPAPARR